MKNLTQTARRRATFSVCYQIDVTSTAGAHVAAVARAVASLATITDCVVTCRFNGHLMVAAPGDSWRRILGEWETQTR